MPADAIALAKGYRKLATDTTLPPIERVFVREPGSAVKDFDVASALYGLTSLYEDIAIDGLNAFDEFKHPGAVSSRDLFLDGVSQTRLVLNVHGIRPSLQDYPEQISHLMNRECRTTTWAEAKRLQGDWFIKPGLPKAWFCPSLIHGPFEQTLRCSNVGTSDLDGDAYGLANLEDHYPVSVSKPMAWNSEWRCFVLGDEILDVRPYSGDWHLVPSKAYVEEVVEAMGSGTQLRPSPIAYAVDFGVDKHSNQTSVIECNDAWALGSYGLRPTLYAQMLIHRWAELWERKF
jgi:hypothetical protein